MHIVRNLIYSKMVVESNHTPRIKIGLIQMNISMLLKLFSNFYFVYEDKSENRPFYISYFLSILEVAQISTLNIVA